MVEGLAPGPGPVMMYPQQSEPCCSLPAPAGRAVRWSSPLVGTSAQPAARATATSAMRNPRSTDLLVATGRARPAWVLRLGPGALDAGALDARVLDARVLDARVLDTGALDNRVLGPGEPGAREARAREPGAGQSRARRALADPEWQWREDKFRAGLSLVWPERQRRADELLAGHPGHGQPEDRTLSAFPPGLQPAVVQPGVLERDGQAQPGAAGRPGPRGVRSPEPVEHHRRFGGPEAHPMVADGYGHRVPVPRHGDDHIPALAVLDRVVQQVAQDALDPAAVHLRDARLGGQPEIDPGPLPRRELLGVCRSAPD